MKATAETKSKFPPIPPDSYHAVCYGVVDIGTEHSEMYNNDQRKVLIMWELPDETIEIEGKRLPRGCSKKYTLSIGEKANLNHDLTGWRGVPFTDDEIKAGFDLKKLLTQNCILTIVPTQSGKSSKVQSVSKMMKTMTKKQPVNKIVYYDIDEHGKIIPDILPPWVVEMIKKSPEYIALDGNVSQSDMEAIDNLPVEDEQVETVEDSSEIPF